MKIKKIAKISDLYYTGDDIYFLYQNGLISIADYREIESIVVEDDRFFINGKLVEFMEKGRIVKGIGSVYFFARNKSSLIVCGFSYCSKRISYYPISVLNESHKLKCLI